MFWRQIWHNLRVQRLETEVASLNRLLNNLQKRLGISDLNDLDDGNAEESISDFENQVSLAEMNGKRGVKFRYYKLHKTLTIVELFSGIIIESSHL